MDDVSFPIGLISQTRLIFFMFSLCFLSAFGLRLADTSPPGAARIFVSLEKKETMKAAGKEKNVKSGEIIILVIQMITGLRRNV